MPEKTKDEGTKQACVATVTYQELSDVINHQMKALKISPRETKLEHICVHRIQSMTVKIHSIPIKKKGCYSIIHRIITIFPLINI